MRNHSSMPLEQCSADVYVLVALSEPDSKQQTVNNIEQLRSALGCSKIMGSGRDLRRSLIQLAVQHANGADAPGAGAILSSRARLICNVRRRNPETGES